MAFEGFRQQTKARPRRNRLTLALSVGVHAALLAVGVAYSFWHIDELTPPSVKVTFLSAAPPPPPPPPPAGGGGGAKKKVVIKPKVVPTKTPDIVQPRETPKEEPKETKVADNEPGGVKGGVKGGTIGGTVGGTIGGTVGGTIGGKIGGTLNGTIGGTGTAVRPKQLPSSLGSGQKSSGDDPAFPPSLRKAGAVYVVQAKICVSRGGDVESVSIMQGADSLLDANVVQAVKRWRYRPYALADGVPVPFCYFGRFEFRGQ